MVENRRSTRNYFPEPRFQFRFLRFLFLASLLQIGATIAILHFFMRQNYAILVEMGGLDKVVHEALLRELTIFITVVSAIFLVHLTGMLFLGVIFSHRIAGVIYAVKRTAKDIIEGKNAQLKFRASDEFQELASEFNLLVENLKKSSRRKTA